jgi:hypothetical protein
MSKHTPGPWQLDFYNRIGEDYVAISAAKHKALAEVVWRFKDDEQSPELEANAHLIAAAPELLEALQLASIALAYAEQEKPGLYADIYTQINAALDKARGET